MNRKLPFDAFDYYFALGPKRSYQAVAEHYGVSKPTVCKRAAHERWQDRLNDLESQARERSDQQIVEDLETMTVRHLKTYRAIQAKALEALRSMPISTAMEAVRALDTAMSKERVLRGEPSDRTEMSVEQIIKREYERWLGPEDEDESDDNGEDPV